MLRLSTCLLIALGFASVQACIPLLKGRNSKVSPDRQIFDQVFSTVGFYLSPEDIFNKLTALDNLYSTSKKCKASEEEKKLVKDLIDLAKLKTCDKENFDKFERYLSLQRNHVNVLAYIQLHKDRLIRKCSEDDVQLFLKAIESTRLNISADLASLRSHLFYANHGFNEEPPYYHKESLAEAIVILMSRKNLELGRRVEEKKQTISFIEFSNEYDKLVRPICDGVKDRYKSMEQIYQKLAKRHESIKEPFKEFSNFWKVNVDICTDILDETKNMPLASYHEAQSSGKGIFSRLFNLNPFSSS